MAALMSKGPPTAGEAVQGWAPAVAVNSSRSKQQLYCPPPMTRARGAEPSPSLPGQNLAVSLPFPRENPPGKSSQQHTSPTLVISLVSLKYTGRYYLLATDGTKFHEQKKQKEKS